MKQNWWVLLLRGLAAILFGIFAYVWPGLTMVTLVLLFGIFALADGIVAVIGSLIHHKKYKGHWWVLLLLGLVSIAAGIFTFLMPGITVLSLLTLIAAWAFMSGVLNIFTSIQLRKEIKKEWLLFLNGIVSVLFGLFVFMRPGIGALSVIWLIATYAVFTGVVFLSLAFKVRGWDKQLEHLEAI